MSKTDQSIVLYVYGAEERCPSCVHLPSSRETATWLEAALQRQFGSERVTVKYVDIHAPQSAVEQRIAQQVIDEHLWYPVVVLHEEIIAEGNPKLREIAARIERLEVKGR